MSETNNNNVPQKKKKTKMIAPQAEAMTMATATVTKGTDCCVAWYCNQQRLKQ